MSNRNRRSNEKKSDRLVLKKETLRALQSVSADDLRRVAGGWRLTTLPSCNGC